MGWPIGNQYYLLRSKDGRDKKFASPEDLANAINKYFEWCLSNPLIESQAVKGRIVNEDGDVKNYELAKIPKMRPFSLEGMCNFIDISLEGFYLYEKREDFVGVTKRARQIIENQQFEGASSGFLNPNIIARKLGLSDKKEVETSVKTAKYVNATRS